MNDASINPPTRHGTVEGKHIYVYDDLVDTGIVDQICTALEGSAFTLTEIARPDTEDYRHWANNMKLEAAQHLPLLQPTILACQPFCQDGSRFRLYRAYTNCNRYGDMLFPHTDCLPGQRELTALWFMARDWDPDWGGETLFFNEQQDAEFVVSPRPGRLVIFEGEISHCGRPPNRICYRARYTLAMKFERVPPDPG